MKTAEKTDIKTSLTALYDMTNEMDDFISLLQTAFIYNTMKPLEGYTAKISEHMKKAAQLSTALAEAAADDQGAKPYASIPDHLIRIWEDLGKLHDLIDKKIREGVLFSDKGVDETIYFLQRVVEMMRPTADMILARNTFLSKYIQESQEDIERMAVGYATLHENRLITGECMPLASSIYLSILEAVKNIAWHTKKIAVALGG